MLQIFSRESDSINDGVQQLQPMLCLSQTTDRLRNYWDHQLCVLSLHVLLVGGHITLNGKKWSATSKFIHIEKK